MPPKSKTQQLLEQAAEGGSVAAAIQLDRRQARRDRAKRPTTATEQAALDRRALKLATSLSRSRGVVNPNSAPDSVAIIADLHAGNLYADDEDATPGARESENARAVEVIAALGGSSTTDELEATGFDGWSACNIRLRRLVIDGLATSAYIDFPASSVERYTLINPKEQP